MENAQKIAIITGSTASLPTEVRQDSKNGVFDVPFIIKIDDEDAFLDRPDISETDQNRFDEALKSKSQRVSTSQPKVESYVKAFFDAENWGATDIMLPAIISPELSGANNAVNTAKNLYNGQSEKKLKIWLPKRTTKVSRAEGNDTLKAIRLREEGLSPAEIIDVIDDEYEDCEMAQIFTSFDQLVKNGRLGRAKGFAGKLGVKAVVTIDLEKGDLIPVNVPIIQSRKWEAVCNIAVEHVAKKFGKTAVEITFTYDDIEQNKVDVLEEIAYQKLTVVNRQKPERTKQSLVITGHSDKGTAAIFAEKARR
jgi:DegV family protein with EDD domain